MQEINKAGKTFFVMTAEERSKIYEADVAMIRFHLDKERVEGKEALSFTKSPAGESMARRLRTLAEKLDIQITS